MASAIIAAARTAIQTQKSHAPNPSRFSFELLLNSFSTKASSGSGSGAAATATQQKPKRRKKKNLFEVAQFLPNWGIGYHMAKSHWKDVSYEITKINLYKDGRHGKAWGIAYRDGLPIADAPKKISGVHKRCWKYIPSLTKSNEGMPNSPKLMETASINEVQPV